ASMLAGATGDVERGATGGMNRPEQGGDGLRFGRIVLEAEVDGVLELSRFRKHAVAHRWSASWGGAFAAMASRAITSSNWALRRRAHPETRNAPVANIPRPMRAMNPAPVTAPGLTPTPSTTAISVAAAAPSATTPAVICARESPFTVWSRSR